MELPAGYTSRPLVMSDAGAVTAVIAAQERHDVGRVEIDESDIVADWQRPSFDVSAATIGVLADDVLVAYAEAGAAGRGDAAVAPEHRGRGLGTVLAHWMQETARSQGQSEIGMPVPADSAGDRLLEQLGYHVRWNSWLLELPAGASVPERPLPAGCRVTAAEPGQVRACWQVVEDAFLEWSVRDRDSFEDWDSRVTGRPGFEPWQLRVVTDGAGEVVAVAALVSYEDGEVVFVDKLATRADQRGRGLAQALLVDAFAAGRAHGATRCELSTDSRTGALGLYERVGMIVTQNWVNRGIAV